MFVFLISKLVSSFECGNVQCTIKNKVLTIEGNGLFTANPKQLDFEKIIIPTGVTIGKESFKDCRQLKDVVLENEQEIGGDTLQGLLGLSLNSLTIGGQATFNSQPSIHPFDKLSIKELYIQSPKVTNLANELFQGILGTSYFELNGGDVPLTENSFVSLSAVKTLIISGKTKLNNGAKNVFRPMANSLTTLTLEGSVDMTDPTLLSGLPELTTLYFGPKSGKLSGGALAESKKLTKIIFSKGAQIAEGEKQFSSFEDLSDVQFFSPTKIPNGAFKDSNVRSVSLENNGITVSENAFANCVIDVVSIISSAKESTATSTSKSLKEATLTIHPKAFTNAAVSAVNVFNDPNSPSLTIPIATVFGPKVNVIQLNDGIKSANSPVFDGLDSIKVAFPPTFESVPPTLFTKCAEVQIGFTAQNSHFQVSEDNAIYNKEGTTLMAVLPQATNVNVKVGVKEINADVFKDHKNLKEVSLPSTVDKIDNMAFTGCSSLAKFTYKGEAAINNKIFDDTSSVSISVSEEYKGESLGGKTIKDHNAPSDDQVNPDNKNDPKKPNKAGVIAGSVVAVVVVVAIIIVVVVVVIKRKKPVGST